MAAKWGTRGHTAGQEGRGSGQTGWTLEEVIFPWPLGPQGWHHTEPLASDLLYAPGGCVQEARLAQGAAHDLWVLGLHLCPRGAAVWV